jgi:hypothetical protein
VQGDRHRLAGEVRAALDKVVRAVPSDGPTAQAAVSELLRISFTEDGSVETAVRLAVVGRLLVPLLARLLPRELTVLLTDPELFSRFGLPDRPEAANLVKWLGTVIDIPSPASEDHVVSCTMAYERAAARGGRRVASFLFIVCSLFLAGTKW